MRLCRHCQAHQLGEPLLMDSSLLLEGEGLIAVGRRAKERTDLIEQATEARSRAAMSEPVQRLIPLFDPPMILLRMVLQVALGPMCHLPPEHRAGRARIGVMPIGRD